MANSAPTCPHLERVRKEFDELAKKVYFEPNLLEYLDAAYEQGQEFKDSFDQAIGSSGTFWDEIDVKYEEVFMLKIYAIVRCKICPASQAKIDLIKREFSYSLMN